MRFHTTVNNFLMINTCIRNESGNFKNNQNNVCFVFVITKVIRRLRERGEPIRLFGESDEEACQRLRLPFELSFP